MTISPVQDSGRKRHVVVGTLGLLGVAQLRHPEESAIRQRTFVLEDTSLGRFAAPCMEEQAVDDEGVGLREVLVQFRG